MNEKHKIIIYFIAAILGAAAVWHLFSDTSSRPDAGYRINRRLDDTAREQQRAADGIAEIGRSIADSQERAERIERELANSQERAGTIQGRIEDAADGIESAARRNAEVEEAIDSAAGEINKCIKLNRSSAEIFERYARGNFGQ